MEVLRALIVLYIIIWKLGGKKERHFHTFAFTFDVAYNIGKEVVGMAEKKHRIIITKFEQRILVRALAELRNQLLGDSKPTEDVNDLTGDLPGHVICIPVPAPLPWRQNLL